MGQEKSMRGGDEDPILRPRPAPLPSLVTIDKFKLKNYIKLKKKKKKKSLNRREASYYYYFFEKTVGVGIKCR